MQHIEAMEESKKKEIAELMKQIKLTEKQKDIIRKEYQKKKLTTNSKKDHQLLIEQLKVKKCQITLFIKILRKQDFGIKGKNIPISLAPPYVKETIRKEFEKSDECKGEKSEKIGNMFKIPSSKIYDWFRCERDEHVNEHVQRARSKYFSWLADIFNVKLLAMDMKKKFCQLHGHSFPKVLVLTDWRMAHLDTDIFLNTQIEFMPTNIGSQFFLKMMSFLEACKLRSYFHTIIFAFGGAPNFENADLETFWEKFKEVIGENIQVCWMAQDWLDNGMQAEEVEQQKLDKFNNNVKVEFEKLNEQYGNYKWCNIRKKFDSPLLDNGPYPNATLWGLYTSYISYFVNECNVQAAAQVPPFLPDEDAEN